MDLNANQGKGLKVNNDVNKTQFCKYNKPVNNTDWL